MKRRIATAAIGAFALAAATFSAVTPASAMAGPYPSPGQPSSPCAVQQGGTSSTSTITSACVGVVNHTHGFEAPGDVSPAAGVSMWPGFAAAGNGTDRYLRSGYVLGANANELVVGIVGGGVPRNGGWTAHMCWKSWGAAQKNGCRMAISTSVTASSAPTFAGRFQQAVHTQNTGVAQCEGGVAPASNTHTNSKYVGCEPLVGGNYNTSSRWPRYDYSLFTKTLRINVTNYVNQRLELTHAAWSNAIRDARGDSRSTASISHIGVNANVVSVTTTEPHGIAVGNRVTISGMADTTLNGGYRVASVPTLRTFTFAKTHAAVPVQADSGRVDIALGNGEENNAQDIAPYAAGFLPVVHWGTILPVSAANTVTLSYKFLPGPDCLANDNVGPDCSATDQVITLRATVDAAGVVSGDANTCTVAGASGNPVRCSVSDFGHSGHDAHYGITIRR